MQLQEFFLSGLELAFGRFALLGQELHVLAAFVLVNPVHLSDEGIENFFDHGIGGRRTLGSKRDRHDTGLANRADRKLGPECRQPAVLSHSREVDAVLIGQIAQGLFQSRITGQDVLKLRHLVLQALNRQAIFFDDIAPHLQNH